ncbi:MAG: aldehyde dehydrogenase [Cytophagales bacterium]|nr:aldehyde dehydrogenase [Cytophagales bacterium]
MTAWKEQLGKMRQWVNAGETRSYEFRLKQLIALKQAVEAHELDIYQALFTDLHKSKEDSWVTENGLFMAEIKNAIRQLKSWMNPQSVSTNWINLPSSSHIVSEPLGVVLIIGPWNYPFQLVMIPLIGAIAAGNCVMVKSSEHAPATASVIQRILAQTFKSEYIGCAMGDGAEVISGMMNNFRFDHVFYTGSTAVGKKIYQLAAQQLSPVTLELGGKSPCVIEEDAHISVAARRIATPKFSNAGQMCIAPDYVLVNESKKEEFVAAMKQVIPALFGEDPIHSVGYGRIINEKQFDRILGYLEEGNIVFGGKSNRPDLFIEPTILEGVSPDAKIMQDEIFGPILPILTFKTMDDAKTIISQHPNPLAFYLFTQSKEKENAWMQAIPSGGVCINNASLHFINPNLPFGGRGQSGMGAYHGKFSFDTFSHKKAVLKTPTWFDPAMKYPPFTGKLTLLKWLVG